MSRLIDSVRSKGRREQEAELEAARNEYWRLAVRAMRGQPTGEGDTKTLAAALEVMGLAETDFQRDVDSMVNVVAVRGRVRPLLREAQARLDRVSDSEADKIEIERLQELHDELDSAAAVEAALVARGLAARHGLPAEVPVPTASAGAVSNELADHGHNGHQVGINQRGGVGR